MFFLVQINMASHGTVPVPVSQLDMCSTVDQNIVWNQNSIANFT